MKSYTDLEQSKELAEILPIESADIVWVYSAFEDDYFPHFLGFRKIVVGGKDIKAWSLAALLGVLPSVIKRKGKRMFLTLEKAGAYNLYYKSPDRLDELWETKEEPIDACVSMIENLHEQKLL
jgi:hypothetical protein